MAKTTKDSKNVKQQGTLLLANKDSEKAPHPEHGQNQTAEVFRGIIPKKGTSLIRQGNLTNYLVAAIANNRASSSREIDRASNSFTLKPSSNFSISFTGADARSVTDTMPKLLDMIAKKYTATADRTVAIPLSEYMALRNLKDIKEARKTVNRDLNLLYLASIDYQDKTSGKEEKRRYRIRILGTEGGIYNGVISVRLHDEFVEIFSDYSLMVYPDDLFKLKGRAFFIGRKLREYARTNAANGKHKIRENTYKISVSALLYAAGWTPGATSDRHFDDRIKKPFEDALDSVTWIKWEYCDSKGKPFSGYAKDHRSKIDVATFLDSYIIYEEQGLPLENKEEAAFQLVSDPAPEQLGA